MVTPEPEATRAAFAETRFARPAASSNVDFPAIGSREPQAL